MSKYKKVKRYKLILTDNPEMFIVHKANESPWFTKKEISKMPNIVRNAIVNGTVTVIEEPQLKEETHDIILKRD